MNLLNDNQINKFAEENNICVHCGGVTRDFCEYNEDIDEDQYYTVCQDCGFEDK